MFASENSTLTTTTLGFLVCFLTARRQACLSLLRTSLAETAFEKVRAAKHTAAEMMIRCIEFYHPLAQAALSNYRPQNKRAARKPPLAPVRVEHAQGKGAPVRMVPWVGGLKETASGYRR